MGRLDGRLGAREPAADARRRSGGDPAAARAGEGQSAISAPPIAIRPPIQIQLTSGLTITRKVAGGGSLR